jgi:hypothetical protein
MADGLEFLRATIRELEPPGVDCDEVVFAALKQILLTHLTALETLRALEEKVRRTADQRGGPDARRLRTPGHLANKQP